uniref:Xylanase inhibitor C-terminal domain-containing protein n=1 Tax=Oryza meridionalis TaxID=40149 RepID=A0A0E0DMZ8_9ORYZ
MCRLIPQYGPDRPILATSHFTTGGPKASNGFLSSLPPLLALSSSLPALLSSNPRRLLLPETLAALDEAGAIRRRRGASRLAVVVVGREEGASSPVDGVAPRRGGSPGADEGEGGGRGAARRRSERFPRVRGAGRRELLPRAVERAGGAGRRRILSRTRFRWGLMCWVGDSYGGLIVCVRECWQSPKKWKKMFAHCLDGKRSGGIFVLGHIVGPKVRKTPLDQTRTTLLEITVGQTSLSLSAGNVEIKSQNMTILETGSLISYLPEKVYQLFLDSIFSDLEDISVINVGGYSCFHYERRFPEVVFHFKELLILRVYPHEYMFHNMENKGIIGRRTCSFWAVKSRVHVRDEPTGKIYEVGSHRMNSDVKWDDEDSITKLFAMIGATICYGILLAMLFLCTTFRRSTS